MAQVNAKCTNCNQEIVIDDLKDADICPHCNMAFVSEKAIKLYKLDSEEEKQVRVIRRRHMFKSFLKGFWMGFRMVFGCIFFCFTYLCAYGCFLTL